jgi:hypothetical protein
MDEILFHNAHSNVFIYGHNMFAAMTFLQFQFHLCFEHDVIHYVAEIEGSINILFQQDGLCTREILNMKFVFEVIIGRFDLPYLS